MDDADAASGACRGVHYTIASIVRTTARTIPVAPATINRELSWREAHVLAGHRGREADVEAAHQAAGENNVHAGFFEAEEYAAVLSHLPEDLQPVVRFAYLIGRRKYEALILTWRQSTSPPERCA